MAPRFDDWGRPVDTLNTLSSLWTKFLDWFRLRGMGSKKQPPQPEGKSAEALLLEDIRLKKKLIGAIEFVGHELHRLNRSIDWAISAKTVHITQRGTKMGQILGIAPGATGEFDFTPNGALAEGSKLSAVVDDTTLSLTQSDDGLSAAIAVPASSTATSFNLTVSGVGLGTGPFSRTVKVPINQPAPPPPPPAGATDVDITQVS